MSESGSVVFAYLVMSVVARWVRLFPLETGSVPGLRWELYGNTVWGSMYDYLYLSSEALISGDLSQIADSSLVASHYAGPGYECACARYTDTPDTSCATPAAWMADSTHQATAWFQVDLGKSYHVSSMLVQGKREEHWSMLSFTLAYSGRGSMPENFQTLTDIEGNELLYEGGQIGHTEMYISLDPYGPVLGRWLRLCARTCHIKCALRWEVFGMESGGFDDLWMTNYPLLNGTTYRINDTDFGVSSANDSYANAPRCARLSGGDADCVGTEGQVVWLAESWDAEAWIQVDLRKIFEIVGVITTNARRLNYYIHKYKVATSTIGSTFNNYQIYQENGTDKIFDATQGLDAGYMTAYFDLEGPLRARWVRLVAVTIGQHAGVRWELLGQEALDQGENWWEQFEGLISGETYRVNDSSLSGSSYPIPGYTAVCSRDLVAPPNGCDVTDGAWRTDASQEPWIQVDLGQTFTIEGLKTKGGGRNKRSVASYKLGYSLGGSWKTGVFSSMNHIDINTIHIGSHYGGTEIYTHLDIAFVARVVRLLPITCHVECALRWELYGAPKTVSERLKYKFHRTKPICRTNLIFSTYTRIRSEERLTRDYPVWCANLCAGDTRCVSFNVGVLPGEVICQLSAATLARNPASFVTDAKYNFYELT